MVYTAIIKKGKKFYRLYIIRGKVTRKEKSSEVNYNFFLKMASTSLGITKIEVENALNISYGEINIKNIRDY